MELTDRWLIYNSQQTQQLAEELANDYVNLLDVDISREEKQFEESIEECLAHLEEVCSVTDNFKQHQSEDVSRLSELLASKSIPLSKFCEEVDRLEQFMFETNRLLDQLEECMKFIESQNRPKAGPIRQIIGLIPRFSRLNILGNVSALIDDTSRESLLPVTSNTDNTHSSPTIEEILPRINDISKSLVSLINELNDVHRHECTTPNDRNQLNTDLKVDRDELEVDGSWQELL